MISSSMSLSLAISYRFAVYLVGLFIYSYVNVLITTNAGSTDFEVIGKGFSVRGIGETRELPVSYAPPAIYYLIGKE